MYLTHDFSVDMLLAKIEQNQKDSEEQAAKRKALKEEKETAPKRLGKHKVRWETQVGRYED